ncbi:22311_t:CDS:2, partial [Racocetra persica]
QPSIIIDPDEEVDLVCRLLFYQPTGYHSNPKKLWKDLKAERYQFPYKKVCEWLTNQNEWQKHAPPPKDTPRFSYERFNKTLAEMLYKIQYAVESISKNPKLIREWVKYLPE